MKRYIETAAFAALHSMGAIVLNSSNALPSQNMLLGVGNAASPETFTTITDILSIEGPSMTNEAIPVSDMSSGIAEYIPGLFDQGEITMEIHFIPKNVQHQTMRTNMRDSVVRNYQITFTDSPATTWMFAAYVTAFGTSGSVNDKLTASLTLRLSGSAQITET